MPRTPRLTAPIVLTIAVLLTGCSQLPTAPSVDPGASRGTGPLSIGRVPDPPAVPDGGSGAMQTVSLVPGQAGTLRAGKFTVLVHKNSLKMNATITVMQPDPNVMRVEFVVNPPAANDFQVPLKVIADCSADSPTDFQNETLYWWSGQWQQAVDVGVNTNAQTLTASVQQLQTGRVAPFGQGAANTTGN